jgi:hypothetical protein
LKKSKLKEEKEFELLEKIRPKREDIIEERLKNRKFAKELIYFCLKFKKDGFVYPSEIREFFRVTSTRVNNIIQNFKDLELIKVVPKGKVVEIRPNNSENPEIFKYYKKAKKVLGL